MRLSSFFSLAIHTGVVTAGLLFGHEQMKPPEYSSPMIVIPLELMTIGEVTDIAPVIDADQMAEETKAEEDAEPVSAAVAPPPPPEDTVNLDEPKPKAKEEKKPEAKPAPPKEDINDFIAQMEKNAALADAQQKKPNAAPAPAGAKATSANEKPRAGAGAQRKATVTVTDYIRAQLVNKRCWTDHSDMADAQRLKATFRVKFAANGKFVGEPELREPSRPPVNDRPLEVYIQLARTALAKCNSLGWQIPKEYWDIQPSPAWIDIELIPQAGAMAQ